MRKLNIRPEYQIYVRVEKSLKIHLTCIKCHCEHAYSHDRRFGTKTRFFTNVHFSRQRYNLHSKSQRLYDCLINGQIRSDQNFDNVSSNFTRKLRSQTRIIIHNIPLLDIPQNKPFHIFQSEKIRFSTILFSMRY